MKNKMVTLITLTLLFTCNNICAQKKLEVGFKGGVNLSSFITDNSTKHYWSIGSAGSCFKPSIVTGGFISYRLIDYLSIQMELLYIQKSYHVEYENHVYGSGDYYSQLSKWDGFQELIYFECTFLIKSKLVLFQKELCKPYAGIYYAVLHDKKYEYDFSYVAKNIDGEITDAYERSIKGLLSNVKNNDFGIILGAEIDLSKLLRPLFIDTRLSMSLDKINENTLSGSVKNLTFFSAIGLKF